MIEPPACRHEVAYWVMQKGAVLILSKDYTGEGRLVLKCRKVIPVMRSDMEALSKQGWVTHHIHMTPPENYSENTV